MDTSFERITTAALAGATTVIGLLVKRMAAAHDREKAEQKERFEDLQGSIEGISDALAQFSDEAQETLGEMRVAMAEMNIDRIKQDIEKLEDRLDKTQDSIKDLQLTMASAKIKR